jgi:hypothetical protein
MKKALFGIVAGLMLFSLILTGCDSLLGTKDKKVERVTLEPTTAKISIGKAITLKATVFPTDATNKRVTWASNKTNTASVSGGVVIGEAKGTAVITVTTEDGGHYATCTVEVTDETGFGEDPKDNDSEEKVQATITVTGIPSNFVGKDYYFSIFPSGTRFEDLYETDPEGYGRGTLSGTTITGQLYGTKAVSGSYLGIILIGSREEPDFVGYTTVNIQGGKSTIAATGSSGFTDVTSNYEPPPEGYGPGGSGGDSSADPEPELPPLLTLSGSITINYMINGDLDTVPGDPINGPVPVYTPLIVLYDGSRYISTTYSCQWNKDNVPIQGGTGRSYLPTEAGAYSVTLSGEGYQSKTSAVVIVSAGSASNAPWVLTAPITIEGKNLIILDIAYGGGKWIAVGGVQSIAGIYPDIGAIAYSTDGITWTGQILSDLGRFNSVAYDGNNTWVAVGST